MKRKIIENWLVEQGFIPDGDISGQMIGGVTKTGIHVLVTSDSVIKDSDVSDLWKCKLYFPVNKLEVSSEFKIVKENKIQKGYFLDRLEEVCRDKRNTKSTRGFLVDSSEVMNKLADLVKQQGFTITNTGNGYIEGINDIYRIDIVQQMTHKCTCRLSYEHNTLDISDVFTVSERDVICEDDFKEHIILFNGLMIDVALYLLKLGKTTPK